MMWTSTSTESGCELRVFEDGSVRIRRSDGGESRYTSIEWAELVVAWEHIAVGEDEQLAWQGT